MSENQKYDILLYAIGFEKRSSYIVQNVNYTRAFALAYEKDKSFSYDENMDGSILRGDKIVLMSQLKQWLLDILRPDITKFHERKKSKVSIAIDVSSLDKKTVSTIFRFLLDKGRAAFVRLHVLYAPASFATPSEDQDQVMDFDTVAGFDGWTLEPELPISAIIGVGYEEDVSLGAIEYLDPSGLWSFSPVGRDERFRIEVEKANKSFYKIVPEEHRIDYFVTNPLSTLSKLRDLCQALHARSRVVIVPSGPKIFNALALLVQHEFGDEVSVWRASKFHSDYKRDVSADGTIVRLPYTPVGTANS